MKAVTQDRYGTPDVLMFRDIECSSPREGEVLVRVVAAGMDRGGVGDTASRGDAAVTRRAPSMPRATSVVVWVAGTTSVTSSRTTPDESTPDIDDGLDGEDCGHGTGFVRSISRSDDADTSG